MAIKPVISTQLFGLLIFLLHSPLVAAAVAFTHDVGAALDNIIIDNLIAITFRAMFGGCV